MPKKLLFMTVHNSKTRTMIILAALLAVCTSWRVLAADLPLVDETLLGAKPEFVDAWQNDRFGMFICWGPVSLTGLEIGWSREGPRGGKYRIREGGGPTPKVIYDNLYKEWKPDHFDARQWVQVAKDAGQRYIIFLVKHHDGFCLFDTKLTEYRSTGPLSAWKHDVMRDVADACHDAGLKLIVYYSQPDWYHPDYRSDNHAHYIEYLHGQIRELLTNYGRVDGIWFDGLGGKESDWDARRLFTIARWLQPWLIINNRCGLPGDFDTPEQRIGKFQLDRPWETCMTLGTQWSWKPDDEIKSLKQCIDVLVGCAIGGGNLALNTNPMPDGSIEPRQALRFNEIGQWMRKYGDSIYGTRGGPIVPAEWGGTTRRGDTVYVHVLKWPAGTLNLPPVGRRIVSYSVLTGGSASVEQTNEQITILIRAEYRDVLDTIIKIELDGSAMDIEPIVVAK